MFFLSLFVGCATEIGDADPYPSDSAGQTLTLVVPRECPHIVVDIDMSERGWFVACASDPTRPSFLIEGEIPVGFVLDSHLRAPTAFRFLDPPPSDPDIP